MDNETKIKTEVEQHCDHILFVYMLTISIVVYNSQQQQILDFNQIFGAYLSMN